MTWDKNELQQLVSNSDSRVFLEQRKIPVVLQPMHLQDMKAAVRDLLNAGIDNYDKSLNGILLGYKHLKVLSKSASVSAESSVVIIDIQANFFIFRPEVGCILKGIVNKISKDHVGVLVHKRFNISCPRPSSEARSEKWLGNYVEMHQEVVFKLKDQSFSSRLPFFKGKLLHLGNKTTEVINDGSKKSSNKKIKDKNKEVEEPHTTDTPTSETNISEKKLEDSSKKSSKKKKDKNKEVEGPPTTETPTSETDISEKKLEDSSKKSSKKKKDKFKEVEGPPTTETPSSETNISEKKLEDSSKKSSKKKKDEIKQLEEPHKTGTPSSETNISEKKLEDLDPIESKVKKPKKDVASHKIMDTTTLTEELKSKKSKKKVSIDALQHTDFIPKLSLDVSQLPDDLPPPNADSTHFDIMKTLSRSNYEVVKKTKEDVRDSIGIVRENLPQKKKETSCLDGHSFENTKRKKEKKEKHTPENESSLHLQHSALNLMNDVKGTHHTLTLENKGVAVTPVKSCSKNKRKLQETDLGITPNVEKKKHKNSGGEFSNKFDDVLLKSTDTHKEPIAEQPLKQPLTEKFGKGKAANVSLQLNVGGEMIKLHLNDPGMSMSSQDLPSVEEGTGKVSKIKKEPKRDNRNASNKKLQKSKKDLKETLEAGNDPLVSDDVIPPGQRPKDESPRKLFSPSRKSSDFNSNHGISPGIGYFPPSSSMVDLDLGIKKGNKPPPLMFRNLQGEIFSPPESPVKSPVKKMRFGNGDSDSASSPPKKVIVTSSIHQSSDSDYSDDEKIGPSSLKTNISSQNVNNSSDSDSENPVENRLLLSMGVIQSPLKKAKPTVKKDSSDSESEQLFETSRSKKVLTSHQRVLSPNSKSLKTSAAAKTNSSYEKQSSPVKSKSSSVLTGDNSALKQKSTSQDNAGSDSDCDLDMMKSILSEINSGKIPVKEATKTVSKPSKTVKGTVLSEMESGKVPGPIQKAKKTASKPSKALKGTGVPKSKTLPKEKGSILLSPNREPLLQDNLSADSDSGPDDKNTTASMNKMRAERNEVEASMKKKSSKQHKKTFESSKSSQSSAQNIHKGDTKKSSKAKKQGSEGVLLNQKSQVKKKSTSDEQLSDVIQRLLKQAKVNVGLS